MVVCSLTLTRYLNYNIIYASTCIAGICFYFTASLCPVLVGLRDRIIRVNNVKDAIKSEAQQKGRPTKYRQDWDKLIMREALNAVQFHEMSIAKAAKMHGIQRTTLSDHRLRHVLPGAKPGRRTLLTSSEKRCYING